MTYRGAVPVLAWGTLFVAMGLMASVQLFVVAKLDLLGKVMLWAVRGCAVLGLLQMAFRRLRGDRNFGVGDAIERWRAWGLFLASALWVTMSLGMALNNS